MQLARASVHWGAYIDDQLVDAMADDLREKPISGESNLLAELAPDSIGIPKLAVSIPEWFAFFVEWVDVAAQAKDFGGLSQRLRAVARGATPTAGLFWEIKSAVLEPGSARDACDALAMGGQTSFVPTTPIELAAMSSDPASLIHLLTFFEGYPQRASTAEEHMRRVTERRNRELAQMKAVISAIESWQGP